MLLGTGGKGVARAAWNDKAGVRGAEFRVPRPATEARFFPPVDKTGGSDPFSSALARRALVITHIAACLGAALGLLGGRIGTVVGRELVLSLCSLLFSLGALASLLIFQRIASQTIATASTIWFSINLLVGMMIAVLGTGEHLSLFVYLVWFFPLLVFNKLVNRPDAGRFLAKFIQLAPLVSLLCLLPRSISVFSAMPMILMGVYSLCYTGFGIMLNIVSRYREEFVAEQERAESLKLESEILESISDCFISLDTNFRLIYLNDAACTEFAIERHVALKRTLASAAPAFFSDSMRAGIELAFANSDASVFEARHNERDIWYVVRCYPRSDSMSVYFQNVTETVRARRELAQAQESLREKAELLDKAQDAIYVGDIDQRISYWNKGAERLYGWKSEEAIGRLAMEIFGYEQSDLDARSAIILKDGGWTGELSQRHRDGSKLTVESHITLVKGNDGKPHSVLIINTDITKRKTVEAKMERLAFYDTLTDLANRQLLRERLSKALSAAIRQDNTGALLFIDLDDFKTLNDTLGHALGDLLLQQVAVRVTSCIRKADTLARLGGDEFVVMLEGLSKDPKSAAAVAKLVADKILVALRQPYKLEHHETEITASIGIARFSEPSDTTDDLLKRGDLAMYRAKAQGRNSVCFFDPEMQKYVTARAALLTDLRRALQNKELELFYQPQVTSDGHVISAEALLRWRHAERGMVPPNEFIPIAEDAGLIGELGRWGLETACNRLGEWAKNPKMEHLSLAVNVSIRQLLDPHFVNLVLDVLRTSGVNPRKLKLEITESSMLEKVEDTIAKINVLKGCGIGFSLDDFGTGYSSLSHLKRLPLDQLKVDRSFIKDLLTNDKDASIARTIITLGQNLNLTVIAEGVETQEQREFLENEGCHIYQGFLFSPALPSSKFEAFVGASC
jgi:diguanylate cyclase (GGDEF)-like protein/PAS domain S-box-containing protein